MALIPGAALSDRLWSMSPGDSRTRPNSEHGGGSRLRLLSRDLCGGTSCGRRRVTVAGAKIRSEAPAPAPARGDRAPIQDEMAQKKPVSTLERNNYIGAGMAQAEIAKEEYDHVPGSEIASLQALWRICEGRVQSEFSRLRKSKKPLRLSSSSWDLLD